MLLKLLPLEPLVTCVTLDLYKTAYRLDVLMAFFRSREVCLAEWALLHVLATVESKMNEEVDHLVLFPFVIIAILSRF